MPPKNVDRLAKILEDDFSKTILAGGIAVLESENPIRAHLFAAALRELLAHLLQTMAPDKEVSEASWFKPEADRPTRRQRAAFAVQGGLADAIVETIGLDSSEMHEEMAVAVKALNQRTHVRPDTLLSESGEIEAFGNQVVDAVLEFLETIMRLREVVADAVAAEASEPVSSKFFETSLDEIDILSTHSVVERADVEVVRVAHIGAHEITYRVEGTVYVELNYGSGSDRARGEGATIADAFPFGCEMKGSVENFKDIHDVSELDVDTSSWYE